MIVLESNWRLLNYRVAYFPTAGDVRRLVSGLHRNALLRIRQTPVTLEDAAHVLHRSVFKALCVDLTRDVRALRAAMDSTSRRWLNRAEKMRPRVHVAVNDPTTRDAFVTLYNDFARLHEHSGPLSRSTLEELERCSDLFMLYYETQPVCGHLWLRDGLAGRSRLLCSASSRLNSGEDAALCGALNRFLHWYEMDMYKSSGFTLYDLGGFENDHDRESSLTRFKLSLGAQIREENDYVIGRGIAVLAFLAYRALPQLTTVLRGRLPA